MIETIKERDLVRELARRVAEITAEPRMEAIRKRWCDVNALRKPDRAPVWCRPVGCWKEIITDRDMVCEDPWLRGIEYGFRQAIHKRDVDDDSPVTPWFGVHAVFDIGPANTWGVDTPRHESDADGGAWRYDPPFKSAAEFERLAMPSFSYSPEKTSSRLDRFGVLLDDILPVRLMAAPPLPAAVNSMPANLLGLEQMMVDMITDPDAMHGLMAHLRDANRKPIIEKFGLSAYGCCENLTHKIDGVLSITNLRIFVCSAWTDLQTVLDKVQDKYCIMWRQKVLTDLLTRQRGRVD